MLKVERSRYLSTCCYAVIASCIALPPAAADPSVPNTEGAVSDVVNDVAESAQDGIDKVVERSESKSDDPRYYDKVTVTGTRLRSSFEAPTPVTSAPAEQLRATSAGLLSDGLIQLPIFKGSSTSATAGASALRGNGAQLLNLRGLGPERTLVLLDGRRVVSSSASGSPDVSLFPQALVSRVEVITGGASATYGSDAVAGVVNFILDDDFEGFRVRGQAGVSDYGDGASGLISAVYGTSFAQGRWQFIASSEFYSREEVPPYNDRDWTQEGFAITTNPNAPPSLLIAPLRSVNTSVGGLITSGPLSGLQFDENGSLVPFEFGTPVSSTQMIGGEGPVARLGVIAGLERWSNFARATGNVSDDLELFVEGAYAQSQSSYDIVEDSASGALGFTIFSDNAYLSDEVRQQMATAGVSSFSLGRHFSDTAPINVESTSDVYRLSAGFDWSLNDQWGITGDLSYGRNEYEVLTFADPIYRNRYAAVDAVIHPTTGEIVCRSTLSGFDPGCEPMNVFGSGSPSPESVAYVQGTAEQYLTLEQTVASIAMSGILFETDAGDVQVAFGGEYRKEEASQETNEIASNPIDGTGVRGFPAALNGRVGGYRLSSTQPFEGDYDVKEAFGEINLPLVDDAPFIDHLAINGAIRYVDYSTVGSTTTWKVGGVYQPVPEIKFRVTRSRDIRAANVGELFTAPVSTQGTVIYEGDARYYIGARSGNPELEPEEADTLTAGIVYRPEWIPGLNLSVDYYDIDLQDAISALTAQQAVDQCDEGNAEICELISLSGSQLIVNNPLLNLSSVKVSGVDVEARYSQSLGSGDLSLGGLVSYLDKFETQTPGSPTVDRAGDISVNGTPKWSATLSANYRSEKLELFFQERIIGKGDVNVTYSADSIEDNSVDAVAYSDLGIFYYPPNMSKSSRISFKVSNLFDKEPPIVPSIPYGGYRATNFSLYDTMGRYFSAGFEWSF